MKWTLGVGSCAVVAYGVWRAMRGFPWDVQDAGDRDTRDRAVTEASEDSFPASDAPSHTPLTASVVNRSIG